MNRPEEILVIQIGTAGISAFCFLVEEENLDKDKDFIAVGTSYRIEEKVFVNEPQLLITGIIGMSERPSNDVVNLVEKLRNKNPQLVVVTFSSCRIEGSCIDRQVKKMDSDAGEQIVQVIKDFRNGALRRKVT